MTDEAMLETLEKDAEHEFCECGVACDAGCRHLEKCGVGKVITELRKRVKGWEQFRGDPPDHKPPPPKSVTTKTILCYEGEEHEFKEQPHD